MMKKVKKKLETPTLAKFNILKEFCDSNGLSYSEIHYNMDGNQIGKDLMFMGIGEDKKKAIVLDWLKINGIIGKTIQESSKKTMLAGIWQVILIVLAAHGLTEIVFRYFG